MNSHAVELSAADEHVNITWLMKGLSHPGRGKWDVSPLIQETSAD